MKKKLILFLILFIFLFNYQSEFFTDTSEESIYSGLNEIQEEEKEKITVGSCWGDATSTSFNEINDKSPMWLIRMKEIRDQQINSARCTRYKNLWKINIDKEREKSRSKFSDFLSRYTCSTKSDFLNKIQVKYNKTKDVLYGDMNTKKKNRIKKIKEAIDLIKDIKFIRKSNIKISEELEKKLKSGVFKNNNEIRDRCTILPTYDSSEINNLF